MLELLASDFNTINRSAIGAIHVFNIKRAIVILKHGMVPANCHIVDNDMVIGATSYRCVISVKNHFTNDHTIKRKHKLDHFGVLLLECKAGKCHTRCWLLSKK